MSTLNNRWSNTGKVIGFAAFQVLLAWLLWQYGEKLGLEENKHKVMAFLLVLSIVAVNLLGARLLPYLKRKDHREQGQANNIFPPADAALVLPQRQTLKLQDLRTRLRQDHGRLWRRKTRLILVIGEPNQIEAIAPGLTQHQWLIGQNTVLLWGGSAQANLADAFKRWHGLSRWRPLDGVVWALDKSQSADGAA
ncbi:ImcF-related family protein, partial [Pseudomonas caspiana]